MEVSIEQYGTREISAQAAISGRPRRTKPLGGMRGAKEGVRIVRSTMKRCSKRAGGKDPCFDRACKEVSARACWKRPITH